MDHYLLNLHTLVASYLYVFLRIGSMFVSMPVIGTKLVPLRIRTLLSILLTVVVAPMLPPLPAIDPLTLLGFITACTQVGIGIIVGLVIQVTFQVVILGGEILAMQSGLSFATMNDPQFHQNVPTISQFYLMAVTLLFLSFNGHLMVIEFIQDSFKTLPIGTNFFTHMEIKNIFEFTAIMFSGAVTIALPAIISLLIVNLTFGIMAKAAPQLNIFSIGFPLTLIFGLAIMFFTFPMMMGNVRDIMITSFQIISKVLGVS